MARCTRCDSELSDGAEFCVTCGSFVETNGAVAAIPTRTGSGTQVAVEDAAAVDVLAACRQALADNPEDAAAYERLGDYYCEQAQPSMAVQAYKQALLYHPHDMAAVQGKLDAAIDGLTLPSDHRKDGNTVKLHATRRAPMPKPTKDKTPWLTRKRAAIIIFICLLGTALPIVYSLTTRGDRHHTPRKAVPIPLNITAPAQQTQEKDAGNTAATATPEASVVSRP